MLFLQNISRNSLMAVTFPIGSTCTAICFSSLIQYLKPKSGAISCRQGLNIIHFSIENFCTSELYLGRLWTIITLMLMKCTSTWCSGRPRPFLCLGVYVDKRYSIFSVSKSPSRDFKVKQ